MYTSSLSMLGHSLATWEAGEFRQALALGSQVAIGTGSRLRLVPGVDTNFALDCRLGGDLPLADSPCALPAGRICPQDCLGLPFGTVLDFA